MDRVAEGIIEKQWEGAQVFTVRTGIKDLVYVEGSVLGGWNMLPRRKGEVRSM